MVEERGFEPLKAKPADLQSAPFDHSGTPPLWSRRSDLNGRPADYKSAALPTELHRQKKIALPLSTSRGRLSRKQIPIICPGSANSNINKKAINFQ